MIRIALYRGTSLISKIIRWQTRSVYSHAAALLDDESVIEAWHIGGVTHVDSLTINHSVGTKVDIFCVEATVEQQRKYENYLFAQVGKKYDFRSVVRFVSNTPACKNDKWFCSELVTAALDHAGLPPLSRIVPAEVSPKLLSLSRELRYWRLVHGNTSNDGAKA